MRKIRHVLVLIFLLTLSTSIFAQDFQKKEAQGFSFEWRIVDSSLEIRISTASTGWISVGFNPSFIMKDADFILAYVKDGKVEISDQFGNGPTSHKPDKELGGTDTVELISGSEEAGKTTVQFKIPLDSGDKFDKKLAAGQSVKVIWAIGPDNADNFAAKHRSRGSFTITL